MTFYPADTLEDALSLAPVKNATELRYGPWSAMPQPGDWKPDLDGQRAGESTPRSLRRAWLLAGRDRAWAADLVQDTFERVLASLHRLLVGSNLRAWLHAVISRFYRDR
jgi:hypothetical protein